MSIIYTVIAREQVMLAQFTPFSGNFIMTVQQILKKCSPSRKQVKFTFNNYIFYVLYLDLIYLVMTDQKYSERIAFAYLQKIKRLFTNIYTEQRIDRMGMYGAMDFAGTMRSNMELYNTPQEVDNVARLGKEADGLNEIINEDLQKLIDRGDKIEILVKKTQSMSALSLDMRSSTKSIKNEMTWQNWKMRIIIGLIIIGVAYFVMAIVCGGVTLSGCF